MDSLTITLGLAPHWRKLLAASIAGAIIAIGISYAVPPIFTARTSFLATGSQGGAASNALSQLGAISGLGGLGGSKTPIDQYVSLLRSDTISNRIIEKFGLKEAYGKQLMLEARLRLQQNLRVAAGRKDNLISIEVDDRDPKRAAAIAGALLDELKDMSANLALTEAKQRRMFFEERLKETKAALELAQKALQSGGFGRAALNTEPKAAAEAYLKLRAEVASATVSLQSLRATRAHGAAELTVAEQKLRSLQAQLAQFENEQPRGAQDPDYVGKFREFKYQENLFETFARQYEVARVDESRDTLLFQVVDPALVPEHKSWPKRSVWALIGLLASPLALAAWLLIRPRISTR